MLKPSMSEVRAYAEKFKTVPVSRTLLSDIKTPVEVLQILKRQVGTALCLKVLRTPQNGDATLFSDMTRSWRYPVPTTS